MKLLYVGKTAYHLYMGSDCDSGNSQYFADEVEVFAPGIPQTPCKHNIANLPRNKAFIWVHYPGSWYSGGKFKWGSCKRAVLTGLKIAQGGSFKDVRSETSFSFKAKKVVFSCNSFGAFFVDVIPSKFEKILYAPALPIGNSIVNRYLDDLEKAKLRNEYKLIYDDLKRSFPYAYRGIDNDEWETIFINGLVGQELKRRSYSTVYVGREEPNYVVKTVFEKMKDRNNQSDIAGPLVHWIPQTGHDFQALYNARHS